IEYHEPPESLSQRTRDLHRAFATLVEEMEAVDWYQHRIDLVAEEDLKRLLIHNRNEEFEHAAMTLEWLRRQLPEFDAQLREYLFTEGPIVEPGEEGADDNGHGSGVKAARGGLGIGSLRKGGGR